jgi:hypothetical protein
MILGMTLLASFVHRPLTCARSSADTLSLAMMPPHGGRLNPHDTTVRNADIWARYFEQLWQPWLGLGAGAPVAEIAEGTAARVAGFLTLVAAGPIAWLYTSNIAQTGNTAEPERLPSRTASEQRSAAA